MGAYVFWGVMQRPRAREATKLALVMVSVAVFCAACSGEAASERVSPSDGVTAERRSSDGETVGERPTGPGGSATETISLMLARDGLGPAKLGSSIDSTLDTFRERWGPPEIRELKCESGATSKIVIWDGVMLVLNNYGLAGYLVGPSTANAVTSVGRDIEQASTSEGLRLGDSVEVAREIYGDAFRLDETTLGPEWHVSTPDGSLHMRGFAGGLSDEDAITRIGLGDICAVR